MVQYTMAQALIYRQDGIRNSSKLKKNEFSKINFLILKNAQLQVSVTIRPMNVLSTFSRFMQTYYSYVCMVIGKCKRL